MHYPELNEDFASNNGVCYGRNINMVLDSYLHALINAKGAARWKEFYKKHKLNAFWQKCLLLIDYFSRETEIRFPCHPGNTIGKKSKEA